MKQPLAEDEQELSELCHLIRTLTRKGEYEKCERLVAQAMGRYPHAPQPHNLMGVLFELQKNHIAAIKHLKAAWALDPTYIPARHNLAILESFCSGEKHAFDENDLL